MSDTLYKYYTTIKNCKTLEILEEVFKTIKENVDMLKIDFNILEGIYKNEVNELISQDKKTDLQNTYLTLKELHEKGSKLKEFMSLLKSKDRKEINKWKDKNSYRTNYYYGINYTKDTEVIYDLSFCIDKNYPHDRKYKDFGNSNGKYIVMDFMKYIDPENSSDSRVTWKNMKKKKEFFELYSDNTKIYRKPETVEERQHRYDTQLAGCKCPY